MQLINKHYPESTFGGYTDIDGTVIFYTRVNAIISQTDTLLDLGCGRGEYKEDNVEFRKNLRIFKGKVKKVIGLDVDIEAKNNPYLDDFLLLERDTWPLEDESVDVIVSDWVLEHVKDPDTYFSEAKRVLKNNGRLCIRTTNKWTYFAIAARLIPNRFHSRVTAFAQGTRKEEDVFPTIYKCNTKRSVKNKMAEFGFESVVYTFESEPRYLSFSRVLYLFGVLHQKFAPQFFKPSIYAFGSISK